MVAAQGIDGTRNWAKNQTEPPFDKFPSDARSIVNSYLGFLKEVSQLDPLLVVAPTDKLTGDVTQGGIAFKIEKEMQAAIRKDLDALESGLIAIDEGIEVSTATGRVDILARDKSGILTVIELKAGSCPSGAIEQVLGYAQSLSDEREEKTRAILIAASFSERQKAATKRTVGLSLKTYSYSLSYENQM